MIEIVNALSEMPEQNPTLRRLEEEIEVIDAPHPFKGKLFLRATSIFAHYDAPFEGIDEYVGMLGYGKPPSDKEDYPKVERQEKPYVPFEQRRHGGWSEWAH